MPKATLSATESAARAIYEHDDHAGVGKCDACGAPTDFDLAGHQAAVALGAALEVLRRDLMVRQQVIAGTSYVSVEDVLAALRGAGWE